MPLPNSRRPSHDSITITSGVEEMSLPNSRRPSHGGITITSGVEEMPLPNSRRPSHGGITITSGVEEMPLPNSRTQTRLSHCAFIHFFSLHAKCAKTSLVPIARDIYCINLTGQPNRSLRVHKTGCFNPAPHGQVRRGHSGHHSPRSDRSSLARPAFMNFGSLEETGN
jgi:hypothetical protein